MRGGGGGGTRPQCGPANAATVGVSDATNLPPPLLPPSPHSAPGRGRQHGLVGGSPPPLPGEGGPSRCRCGRALCWQQRRRERGGGGAPRPGLWLPDAASAAGATLPSAVGRYALGWQTKESGRPWRWGRRGRGAAPPFVLPPPPRSLVENCRLSVPKPHACAGGVAAGAFQDCQFGRLATPPAPGPRLTSRWGVKRSHCNYLSKRRPAKHNQKIVGARTEGWASTSPLRSTTPNTKR